MCIGSLAVCSFLSVLILVVVVGRYLLNLSAFFFRSLFVGSLTIMAKYVVIEDCLDEILDSDP